MGEQAGRRQGGRPADEGDEVVARRGARTAAALAVVGALAVVSSCARPIVGVVDGASGGAPPSRPTARAQRCALPTGDAELTRADPSAVDLDADAVTRAVEYASATGAQSLRIYRHDCLVATSGNDPEAEWVPLPAWSMTKGVVSILVGRAVQLGRLRVDDPIGRYLHLEDPAKAALTVRELLNQVTGLRMAWVSDLNEAATTDSAAAVLARPFEAVPGTRFMYAQTTVTALVSVVEAAIGEDLQSFAQRELFTPIGIGEHEWRWGRDGSGRTQGFAFLDMSPRAFGRLGTLLLHGGVWEGRRLLPVAYVSQGATGTAANPCYGFLWWTNAGSTCRNSGFPADILFRHRWIGSVPDDAFGLSGLFDQLVMVIPSLDVVVVRMGLPHELLADPLGDVHSQKPAWDYRFFRILLSGVTDAPVRDPGDWVPDPPEPPVDWTHILDVPLPDPVEG